MASYWKAYSLELHELQISQCATINLIIIGLKMPPHYLGKEHAEVFLAHVAPSEI